MSFRQIITVGSCHLGSDRVFSHSIVTREGPSVGRNIKSGLVQHPVIKEGEVWPDVNFIHGFCLISFGLIL